MYRGQLAQLDEAGAFCHVDPGSNPEPQRWGSREVVGSLPRRAAYVRGSLTCTSTTTPLALASAMRLLEAVYSEPS
eukprot:scaffold195833_cov18-Prasinocladus_malaysianus.AAC.2